MNDASDRDLIGAMREGSRGAGDALFRRHWPGVWRAAYAVVGERALADDAAQRAIERAIRSLDGFDTERPFAPWVRRIAVNQAIDLLRDPRRGEQPLRDATPEPDVYAEMHDRDELLRAVAELDTDRRVVVAMRYWLDLDPPEIAEALGIPVGTVSSRLARGLADLRELLEVTADD